MGVSSSAQQLQVVLQGAPGERVVLSAWKVGAAQAESQTTVLDAQGAGSATFAATGSRADPTCQLFVSVNKPGAPISR